MRWRGLVRIHTGQPFSSADVVTTGLPNSAGSLQALIPIPIGREPPNAPSSIAARRLCKEGSIFLTLAALARDLQTSA
jgi:hypothetical protein